LRGIQWHVYASINIITPQQPQYILMTHVPRLFLISTPGTQHDDRIASHKQHLGSLLNGLLVRNIPGTWKERRIARCNRHLLSLSWFKEKYPHSFIFTSFLNLHDRHRLLYITQHHIQMTVISLNNQQTNPPSCLFVGVHVIVRSIPDHHGV
jgi:hypothetical protein